MDVCCVCVGNDKAAYDWRAPVNDDAVYGGISMSQNNQNQGGQQNQQGDKGGQQGQNPSQKPGQQTQHPGEQKPGQGGRQDQR